LPPPAPPGAPPKKPNAGSAGSAASSAAGATHAAAARTASGAAKSASGYVIQLGAFKSGSKAANRRWAVLAKKYPAVLKGLSPTVATTKSKSGTLYRLQVTGLARTAAETVCKRLVKHQEPCVVVPKARAK
jgi:cell division protein FtsN